MLKGKPPPPEPPPNDALRLTPPFPMSSVQGDGAEVNPATGRISSTSGTYFLTAAYNRASEGTTFRAAAGQRTVTVDATLQGFTLMNGGVFLGRIAGSVVLDLSVTGEDGGCTQSLTLLEVLGSWAGTVNESRSNTERLGCSFTRSAADSSKPYLVQLSVSTFSSSLGVFAMLTASGDYTASMINVRFGS